MAVPFLPRGLAMDRSEWLNKLEALHVDIRERRPLSPEALAWYGAARASLLQTAVEVQSVALAGDDRPRRFIRVARPAQVLLEARGWTAQTLTVDLGGGGFAVVLVSPPPFDQAIQATLALPIQGPVVATVGVADTRAAGQLFRVAFRFTEPSRQVQDRIETSIVDGILEQLVFWDDVLDRLRF
jgi:hypothetical protein